MSDEELVSEVRAGNSEAFEVVYNRMSRQVLAFCTGMLGSREEAEDVLQQTFASAYRSMRRGSQEISLRPWLYAIAR